MRKYRRMLLRGQANNLGAKPSKYIHKMWERYQINKYSSTTVALNKAKGTHKKNTWKGRINLFAYNRKRGLIV